MRAPEIRLARWFLLERCAASRSICCGGRKTSCALSLSLFLSQDDCNSQASRRSMSAVSNTAQQLRGADLQSNPSARRLAVGFATRHKQQLHGPDVIEIRCIDNEASMDARKPLAGIGKTATTTATIRRRGREREREVSSVS